MPYIRRDAHGEVCELCAAPGAGAIEYLESDDPEVAHFLERTQGRAKQDLEATDLDTVRVLEDVIEALLRKSVITIADLPDSALAKLEKRKRLRRILRESPLLLDDDIL